MSEGKDGARPEAALPGESAAPDGAPIELEREAAASAARSERRLLVMVLVVGAVAAVMHLTPLKQFSLNLGQGKTQIQALGFWAPLAFTGLSAVLIALGLPRMLFCWCAGLLFGFWQGFMSGQVSALLGSYATFLFARWGGREWVRRRVEGNDRIRNLLTRPSTFSIFLIRQIPIAGIVPNLVLGMTPVRHRHFILGSFLGYLPSSLLVALIGSGVGKPSLGPSMRQITFAMLGLLALSLTLWRLKKRLPGLAPTSQGNPS
jgi:uncharacterized membrane protein YdjX (TVP38/TMEM64 family)